MLHCFYCSSRSWLRLPDPHPDRSLTTSCILVNESLGKSQCADCGLVQRTAHPFLGLGDFYQRQYAPYYERLGVEEFNAERYRQLAEWVGELAGLAARPAASVLEIGCGRGWTLEALRAQFPDLTLAGVEPSLDNSTIAREQGFEVLTGTLQQVLPQIDRRFDVLFSNHVLQHTVDPVQFLADHLPLLAEDGLVVLSMQDASSPSNELLFSDQNFSLTPAHLAGFGRRAGLEPIAVLPAPPERAGLYLSMLAVFKRAAPAPRPEAPVPDEASRKALFDSRQHYLSQWAALDAGLQERAAGAVRLVNFGAGMFSSLLAAYAPKCWARVEACVVDGQGGQFSGLQVYPSMDALPAGETPAVVMGVRPWIQPALSARLAGQGYRCIRWDDLVST
ncbi:class I SAM-dependent DNA methyltransferase [Roseateles toxinivorans]|uniref:Methyltransferase family protein n=1 Tax=Roseateles toxinivorans TaxID=270368 RepID=A0A4R6QN41_9BURK|nr:class I SAM-dependent methyltransferase [Roseateles toxinivorans]TDP71395.1 methyltransferase family protein [Roseateles toxinivorans]